MGRDSTVALQDALKGKSGGHWEHLRRWEGKDVGVLRGRLVEASIDGEDAGGRVCGPARPSP